MYGGGRRSSKPPLRPVSVALKLSPGRLALVEAAPSPSRLLLIPNTVLCLKRCEKCQGREGKGNELDRLKGWLWRRKRANQSVSSEEVHQSRG